MDRAMAKEHESGVCEMIDRKKLEEYRKHFDNNDCDGLCTQGQELCDAVDALLKVKEAAEKIVRPSYRQSKENAPLEYALWEALDKCEKESGR